MVFGVLTSLLRRTGSHTPKGNFSSKRGNKNFYKGKGGRKYGKPDRFGIWRPSGVPVWHMPDMTNFKLKAYVGYGEGLPKKLRPGKLNDTEAGSNQVTE